MPGQNDFKAFASGGGANALTPSAWAALTALLTNGFQAGTASSAQINTVLRQASTAAAGVGQFIANQEINAIDDGSPANFASRLLAALQALFAAKATANSRAWVVFNGVTGSILASYNVSSITKVATGVYEINFATALANANYGFSGSCGEANGTTNSTSNPGGNNVLGGTGPNGSLAVRTVNKLRVYAWEAGAANATEDCQVVSVNVFGE